MSKLLEAKYGTPDRPLKVGNMELQCYVLDDERRVIVQSGMIRALGMSRGSAGEGSGDRLAKFISGQRINQFISKELADVIEKPIKFQSPTAIAYGYEATVLVDICDAIIESNKEGKLQKQQQHIAKQAEMLIRAFAKTGVIALIDEVTGYEKAREKDSLQKFLDRFLLEEKAKWVKTFPDEFFEMLFKMKGWTWHYASTKKPGVVGHYINDFVYSRVGPQILKELREKNPVTQPGQRKARHHQFTSPDYGHPKLKEHIAALIALGKGSGYNWLNFKRFVERAFPKFNDDGSQSLQLGFPETED